MDENKVDFKKMTDPQLEELRDRQLTILKNKLILRNLADKGERAKQLLEKIECELNQRKAVEELENRLNQIDINKNDTQSGNPKYVEHICSIETSEKIERFKPFRPPKIKDTSKACKQIALRESVDLQAKQAVRVQEEYIRTRYREKVEEFKEESGDSSSNESGDDECEGAD